MTDTDKALTGGEHIQRGIKFYSEIVAEIANLPEEKILEFSVSKLIASKLEGKTEEESLDIFMDIQLLAESLDIFGQAFSLVGKTKFQQGASNVS